MKYHVLYNPQAGNGHGAEVRETLPPLLRGGEISFYDMTAMGGYAGFFSEIDSGDIVVVCGGDGTLNRFINETENIGFENDIFYFASGSGNDFLHDTGRKKGCEPFCVNRYIKDLPTVTVNDRTFRFLNGVGYGIDGYCCEVGDELRKTPGKKINYTSIAIKGLLFHYKPTNAVVTVDGKRHEYKKVWLAPTMNGRFYGGGMMPTPGQDRLSPDKKLSTLILFGSGKLKTLIVFPKIFKGEHVRRTEMVEVLSGHDITVEFDRPTAIQIDGETIRGVTKYSARACIPAVQK